MDQFSKWINDWIKFAAEARSELSQIHGCEISALDFLEAVREKLGFEKASDLYYEALPEVAVIVDALKDYGFKSTIPTILQEIVVEEQFIPDKARRLLEEQTIKAIGYVWRIHQDDTDPFPSSPHAHDVSSALKLHLGTGELFQKRTLVSQIRCKHLKILRSKVRSDITLPEYACG